MDYGRNVNVVNYIDIFKDFKMFVFDLVSF